MNDRLRFVIRQRIDERKDTLVGGFANDFVSYRSIAAQVDALKWVLEEIDRLERTDDDDDSTFGSVEEFGSISVEEDS